MKAIYTATSAAHADEEDQRDHHWVSVDNQRWLEVESPWPMKPKHYDELASTFAGTTYVDEDGNKHRTAPIAVATGYLRCWCPKLRFHEPIEVRA